MGSNGVFVMGSRRFGSCRRALAFDQGDGVRVLLLARSAGDWWDQLGVAEPAVKGGGHLMLIDSPARVAPVINGGQA
jgi:hypothetical protein